MPRKTKINRISRHKVRWKVQRQKSSRRRRARGSSDARAMTTGLDVV